VDAVEPSIHVAVSCVIEVSVSEAASEYQGAAVTGCGVTEFMRGEWVESEEFVEEVLDGVFPGEGLVNGEPVAC